MTSRAPPDASLQLQWIFGYNGVAKKNVHFLSEDVIVYFTAGVGVVYRLKEQDQKYFRGHNDDITCLAVSEDKSKVATGQIGDDPYICVWHPFTLETLSVLKDAHMNGIRRVQFNSDGKHLASLGMDDPSTLVVWNWQRGVSVASTTAHSARVVDLCWSPYQENQLATCGEHHLRHWQQLGNSFKSQGAVFGDASRMLTLTCVLYLSEKTLVTGTEKGQLYVWKGTQLHEIIEEAHEGPLLCLALARESLVTGGEDGHVKMWTSHFDVGKTILARSPAVHEDGAVTSVSWEHGKFLIGTKLSEIFLHHDQTSECYMQGHGKGELWGLCPYPEDYLFVTAAEDRSVRVWDVEKRELLLTTRLDLPAMSCGVSPDSSQIAVGLKYGTVVILNAKDLSEVARFSDRKEDISEVKFSPDGALLAVGSHDSIVDVYSTSDYGRTAVLEGASSYITHLDWSSGGKYIEINSGAGERLTYNATDGKQVTNSDELHAIEWASRTGVLGSKLSGIWPRYSDLTDINSADVDMQGGVVVTGDDFGLVKLFRFPCRKKGSKHRSFVGHSEHVTGVRFTSARTHVISIGGGDRSIFVWKYQPGSPDSGDDMVAARKSVQFSEDDQPDTDTEQFPEIYTDVENEQSVLKPSRVSRKRREKRAVSGSHRGVPQHRSAPNGDTKLPEAGLKLKFAGGYRGHDTRNNLHFSREGHLVYHLAALGIVYDPATMGQRFYQRHTDDILCLTVQAGTDVVATGQMGAEPAIHVWSADTLETLSVLSGHHQRAVVCVALSQQGSVLASVGGDDHHTLVLWSWQSGQKIASARGHSEKVFDLAFDPTNPHKLMTAGVRHIRFWTRSGGGLTWKRSVLGTLDNQDTMLCCAMSGDGSSFSGGASGTVYTWQNGKVARTVRAHRGPVYCIATPQEGYLTAGQDGYVCLWDQEFAKCLKIFPISNAYVTAGHMTLTSDHPSIRSCAMGAGRIVAGTQRGEIVEIYEDGTICVTMAGHGRGEVWGLDTHPSTLEFVTVSDDRWLRVWNRFTGAHMVGLRKPARSVAYNSDGSCLAVGFLDGSLSLFSADTLLRASTVHHRDSQVSAVRFSPGAVRGRGFLAAASHDDVVDLYHWSETGQLRRIAVGKDASSYISQVDWLSDGRLIRSNSGAGELLYHDCPAGRRQLVPRSVEPLLDWHTETCVLSPSLAGIWAPEDDFTDINAVDRSPDRTLVASACDDGGMIKLFRYPAREKCCRFRKYTGHSSHVTNVRWSYDGQYLMSVGGADCSALVWSRVLTTEVAPGYTNPLDPDSGDDLTVHDLELTGASGGHSGDPAQLAAGRPGHVSGDMVTSLYLQSGEVYAVVTRTSIVGYNIAEGSQVLGIQHEAPVLTCAAASPHDVAAHSLLAVAETDSGSSISVIDVARGADTVAMLMTPNSPNEEIFRMRFSDSGRFLLCCIHQPGQYSIRVWNWKKAMQVAQTAVDGTLLDADFSPSDDLKLTVVCSRQVLFGKIVGVAIQLQKGYIPKRKKGSDRKFLCVACGPEHTSYTGTSDGRLLVWKGPIMSQVVEVSQHGPVTSVAVSRNGSSLLTSVRSVQNSVLLHRWTTSVAVEWNYSLEVAASAHIESVSWAKGHVLLTIIADKKAHVTEVNMKEKKHRELMEVML